MAFNNVDFPAPLTPRNPVIELSGIVKFIELMASAAANLGLDYKQALLLSSQTALGSAKMVLENNFEIDFYQYRA